MFTIVKGLSGFMDLRRFGITDIPERTDIPDLLDYGKDGKDGKERKILRG